MENNMTEKVVSIISSASQIALDNLSQEIDVPHVIKAMLSDSDSMLKNVLGKIGANAEMFEIIVDGFINSKIKSSNVSQERLYLAVDTNNLLSYARKYQSSFEDKYVSVEHLILSLFDSKHSIMLKLQNVPNFNKKKVMEAIKTINLTKKYKDVIAVDNLYLIVKKGELFSLLGIYGAGKSTTI